MKQYEASQKNKNINDINSNDKQLQATIDKLNS